MKKLFLTLAILCYTAIAKPAEFPTEEIRAISKTKSDTVNEMLFNVLNKPDNLHASMQHYIVYSYNELVMAMSFAELQDILSKTASFHTAWKKSEDACREKGFFNEQFIQQQGSENSDFHDALTELCLTLGDHIEDVSDENQTKITKLFTDSFYLTNQGSKKDRTVLERFTHFYLDHKVNPKQSWYEYFASIAAACTRRNPFTTRPVPSIRFTPASIDSEEVYEEGTLEIVKK